MMAKDQCFDVTCPDCRVVRSIGYTQMTLVRRGKRSGRCHSCATATRGRNKLLVASPEAASLRRLQLHAAWQRIWNRCTTSNARKRRYYGDRGIQVCERWRVFDAFLTDMSSSYKEGLSLDRIDPNGPYSPENCRWATQREQMNNMRRNRRVTFQGRTQTVAQWAAELGLNYHTLLARLDRKWPLEEALTGVVMTRSERARNAARARWHRHG